MTFSRKPPIAARVATPSGSMRCRAMSGIIVFAPGRSGWSSTKSSALSMAEEHVSIIQRLLLLRVQLGSQGGLLDAGDRRCRAVVHIHAMHRAIFRSDELEPLAGLPCGSSHLLGGALRERVLANLKLALLGPVLLFGFTIQPRFPQPAARA